MDTRQRSDDTTKHRTRIAKHEAASLRIRTARTTDLDALVALEQESFTADRLSRRSYRLLLARRSAIILVARSNGELAGSAVLLFNRSTFIARLYSIAVARKFRTLGIARSLLRSVERCALARDRALLRLEVRPDNTGALTLYESEGFVQVERVVGYYADGSDALRLEHSLWDESRRRKAFARRRFPLPVVSSSACRAMDDCARALPLFCPAHCRLDQLVTRTPRMPRSVHAFSVHVYFGEAEDACFEELAQQAFARLRCPLLRIDLERAKPWRIVAVHALDPRDVFGEHDDFFLHSLDAYVQRRWQQPRSGVTTRFDLAVLRDPDDPMPPSKTGTLERLVEVGRQMDIDVVLIERKDYPRLAQFDALFIRETTAVPHHTFRFARRAEREGLPVIDDSASILRCTNKVFLAELLRSHGVATPRTRFVTRRSLDAIDKENIFPVIAKIPDGSFSIGVERANDPVELRKIAERMLKRSEIILLQDFVQTEFDWRIGVLDGVALFAARYFMCDRHWQILKHAADGTHTEGATSAVAIEEVPAEVLDPAVRAAGLIGRGLYGVDLKQTQAGVFVIEVNDNPNIDVGMEDAALGDDLYRRLLQHFLLRADELRTRVSPTAIHETWADNPRKTNPRAVADLKGLQA